MEQKLADYRARKAKLLQEGGSGPGRPGEPEPEKKVKSLARVIKEGIHSIRSKWRSPDIPQKQNPDLRMETMAQPAETTEELAPLDTPSGGSIWKISLLLKVLLWLVLLGLFVELEFGLAYFVLSMFYWIYEGTRKPGQRKRGEKSAYSVFNPGCESIQGTLTAEQFERELQYGSLARI